MRDCRRECAFALLIVLAACGVAGDGWAQGPSEQAARDYNAAAALQNEGIYPRAAEKWNEFLKQHPNDECMDRARYYLGICQLHLKQYREAVQTLRIVLEKHPNFASADGVRYNLATAYYQMAAASGKPEDYRPAADLFGEVAAKHPASKHVDKALYLQGESLAAAKDLAGAIDAYKKLVALGGNRPLLADAYYALGTAQQDLGRDADASTTFQAFVSKFASHDLAAEVRLRLGLSLLNQKKLAEAETALAAAAAAKKAVSAEAAYWRARTLLKMNKPQEALSCLDEALKNFLGGDFRPYLELARADAMYELPARRKETPALYDDFVKRHANHPLLSQATYMAAISSLGEKDKAAARRHAETFLADPKLSRPELVPAVLYVAAEACLGPEPLPAADLAKAEQYFRRLIDQYPQHARSAQARLRLAWCLLAQKKLDEAATRYEDVLKQASQKELTESANYGLAEICFAKEQYEKALAPLDRLLASPTDPDLATRGRYLRGMACHRLKQFDRAIADLEAVQGKLTGDPAFDARCVLVLSRIAHNQLDRVKGELEALLRDKPTLAQADQMHYEWGHALLRGNKPVEAAAAFRALAEKRPDSPLAAESWFHVGQSHEDAAEKMAAPQKDAELAKAATAYSAGAAKAREPELREKLRYKLADVQFRQKQYDQAIAALTAQLAERASGELAGPARFLQAESHFARNEFDKALPLFGRVADDKVEKCQALALYRAGDCAARLKQWPESEKRYRAVIDQFPKFDLVSDARYGLAVAAQNQGKAGEARTLYEQIVKESQSETAAKARFMLGELAVADHKYADAIEQHLLVATTYPYKDWQALARFEMGRCYMALGEKAKAMAAYQLVVDRYADHPKAAEAAKLLQELKR
jgi:TolA-binding protein